MGQAWPNTSPANMGFPFDELLLLGYFPWGYDSRVAMPEDARALEQSFPIQLWPPKQYTSPGTQNPESRPAPERVPAAFTDQSFRYLVK
jgi:hypothetical protein